MKYRFLLGVIAVTWLTGCATVHQPYIVNVDSINDPQTAFKTKYLLLSGIKDVGEDDLQFREYAGYVDRALAMIGYTKATSFDEAEIAVYLSYGIGDPESHTYSYSVPTWGQTGVSSSITYGTVNVYGNTASYSGTTTYAPQYGVIGSRTHVDTIVTYYRYMILDVVDLEKYRETEEKRQLWKTTATSTGTSGDLRRVFPILVAASKEYFGTNTGKRLRIILYENDERVIEVKGFVR